MVPDVLALVGVALAGTERLRQPTGDPYDTSKGPMLIYGPTCNGGQ